MSQPFAIFCPQCDRFHLPGDHKTPAAPHNPMKKSDLSAYFAKVGARGGRAGTGAAKARSSEQARAAVRARWEKHRAAKDQEKK